MPVVHGLAHARDLLNLLRLEKVAREVRDGGEAADAVGVARGGDRDGARRASPEEEDGDGIDGGGEGLETGRDGSAPNRRRIGSRMRSGKVRGTGLGLLTLLSAEIR